MAMCLGAAASVWNFNRTADALQALRTRPPLDPLRPLIDDLNGIDMAEFLDLLGLQTKPSKAQKPAKEQVIQRVLVAIGRDGVVLRPTPALWITRTIDDALATNELAPHTAGRLAGRLNFVTQSTFGAVGKAGPPTGVRQGT